MVIALDLQNDIIGVFHRNYYFYGVMFELFVRVVKVTEDEFKICVLWNLLLIFWILHLMCIIYNIVENYTDFSWSDYQPG